MAFDQHPTAKISENYRAHCMEKTEALVSWKRQNKALSAIFP